jgi:lysozyme
MNKFLEELKERLKKEEGKASNLKSFTEYSGLKGKKNSRVKGSSDYGLYYDSRGKLTGLHGRLITSDQEAHDLLNATKEDAEKGLDEDISRHIESTDRVLDQYGIDKNKLSKDQLMALTEMGYQLGPSKMAKFKKTLNYVKEGNYEEAAKEAEDSNWYKQTPKRVKNFQKNIIKKQPSRGPAGNMNKPLTEEDELEIEQKRNLEKAAALHQMQIAQKLKEQAVVKQTAKDVMENPEAVSEAVKKENNLRPEQKEDIVIQMNNPEKAADSAQNNISGETKPGLKDQFIDALTYFGPQILAGFYGQSQAGDAGMVSSMQMAGQMRDSYVNHAIKKEELELKQQQALQSGQPSEYQQRSLEMRQAELDQRKKEEERRIVSQSEGLKLREKSLSQGDVRLLESSAKNFIAKGTPAEREVSQLSEINRVRDLIKSGAPFKGLLESAMAKGLGGEVGNLAVEERQAAAQIVGYKGKLADFEEFLTSNISDLRKEEINKLLDFMEPKLKLRLSQRAERYSKDRAKKYGLDKESYRTFLLDSTGIAFDNNSKPGIKSSKGTVNRGGFEFSREEIENMKKSLRGNK